MDKNNGQVKKVVKGLISKEHKWWEMNLITFSLSKYNIHAPCCIRPDNQFPDSFGDCTALSCPLINDCNSLESEK